MISDSIAIYGLIKDLVKNSKDINTKSKIKKAIFDWDGTKIEGDKDINIDFKRINISNNNPKITTIVEQDSSKHWCYYIKPIIDYIFVHFPLNPSGVIEELTPLVLDPQNVGNEEYFRYIQAPNGFVYNNIILPNVKAKFIVIAYHKSIILETKGGE